MLLDLALISILLVVSQLLRSRVRVLARLMLPASVIAGVLGIVGGRQGLGIIPFSLKPGGTELQIADYPGVLIVLVFATLLMGRRGEKGEGWRAIRGAGDTLFYNLAAEIAQYGLALLFGLTILRMLYPAAPNQFGVMLAAGFAGGHGTAAIFGQGFAAQGWSEAQSIGFAFATIGLLVSIIGGVILLNLGARLGWAAEESVAPAAHSNDAFLAPAKQFSIGAATVNPSTLDPLAWHIALVVAVYGLTQGIDWSIHRIAPGGYWLPGFAIAMLVGALVQKSFDAIGVGQFVDAQIMRRIGSTCADFLVACGIASIKLSVVREYAGPMLMMSAFGLAYALLVFAIGPWIFRRGWFERSIFTYGWNTGTLGISVALLRVVDPQLRSGTMEDYGAAYLLIGPIEMMLYPAVIWAIGADVIPAAGLALTAVGVLLFYAARRAGGAPAFVVADPTVPDGMNHVLASGTPHRS